MKIDYYETFYVILIVLAIITILLSLSSCGISCFTPKIDDTIKSDKWFIIAAGFFCSFAAWMAAIESYDESYGLTVFYVIVGIFFFVITLGLPH